MYRIEQVLRGVVEWVESAEDLQSAINLWASLAWEEDDCLNTTVIIRDHETESVVAVGWYEPVDGQEVPDFVVQVIGGEQQHYRCRETETSYVVEYLK